MYGPGERTISADVAVLYLCLLAFLQWLHGDGILAHPQFFFFSTGVILQYNTGVSSPGGEQHSPCGQKSIFPFPKRKLAS